MSRSPDDIARSIRTRLGTEDGYGHFLEIDLRALLDDRDAKEARIKELEGENRVLRAANQAFGEEMVTASGDGEPTKADFRERLSAAEALLEEAAKVIEPFALHAGKYDTTKQGYSWSDAFEVTEKMGDLRRARDFAEKLKRRKT